MLARFAARRIPQSTSSAFVSSPFSLKKEERRSIHSAAAPKLGPSTWLLIISGALVVADKYYPADNLLNETAEENEFIAKAAAAQAADEAKAKDSHHH